MINLTSHLAALSLGALLDLLIGDPHSIPHPVSLIGALIHTLDESFRAKAAEAPDRRQAEHRYGALLAVLVLLATGFSSLAIVLLFYRIGRIPGILVEAVMTCQILAARSLAAESGKVGDALEKGDLPKARTAVSMIVGRDTKDLDAAGITRAAVETVAENTCDGVIAPLLYTALGGPVLGFCYKAVNTMDSMIGYRNDTYRYFGTAAARLDDVLNFLPARLSAWLLILSCPLLGKAYDIRGAVRIWRRDRKKHKSPNSAQTEAAMAGALGLRLAGPASYFGVPVEKPYLGDAKREIEPLDIKKANSLMFTAAFLCFLLCTAVLALFV